MRISVVPFGTYKSYNFQINAKSTILSDLKYNKGRPGRITSDKKKGTLLRHLFIHFVDQA